MMINIFELIYDYKEKTEFIKNFNESIHHYQHAEFEKDNDYYQIVMDTNSNFIGVNYYKEFLSNVSLIKHPNRLTGDWWMMLSNNITYRKTYTMGNNANTLDYFYRKIKDRLFHNYEINRLVIDTNIASKLLKSTDDNGNTLNNNYIAKIKEVFT